ncbi:hypothetical protein WDW89_12090 [Deltaproteobacteria bacterium TL4]
MNTRLRTQVPGCAGAKTHVVVAVGRIVVVAIRRTRVVGIVVETAATIHTVRALCLSEAFSLSTQESSERQSGS